MSRPNAYLSNQIIFHSVYRIIDTLNPLVVAQLPPAVKLVIADSLGLGETRKGNNM